jgi:preprotein translocase subunit SecE
VNRETKRMTERQVAKEADVDAQGFPEIGDAGSAPRATRTAQVGSRRTSPVQFAREIRDELRQVAWPSRAEMVNYSMVVFFTLVLMVGLIFLLNFAFGKGVFFMFQK